MRYLRPFALCVVLFAQAHLVGQNQATPSSKEYAVMAKELWSAFSCSSWAAKIDDQEQQKRLFLFGYEQGKRFLGALRDQKIDKKDVSGQVPVGVLLLLEGPTNDFILGRIFENAQGDALEEVFWNDHRRDKLNPEEMQKLIAGNKFRAGNCRLIGN